MQSAGEAGELAPIRDLTARIQIEDVVKRYASAVDDKDWSRLESCFTQDAVGNYIGMARLEGSSAIVEWVASKVRNARSTMHLMSNIEVVVEGTRARSRCYGTAFLVFSSAPGELLATRGIVYTDELVRADGEWRIGASIGPICNSMARVWRNSSASGISFQAKRGMPMSTVTVSRRPVS